MQKTALALAEATSASPFVSSYEKMMKITDQLSTKKSKAMSHSEIERVIKQEGRELLRRLMEDHIALRGEGDVGESVQGSDGVDRNHKSSKERGLTSIFGKVSVARKGYSQREKRILFPKDAILNLPKESHSHEFQKLSAQEISKGSYDETCVTVEENTGVKLGKRQAEEIAQRAAQDFDNFYEEVSRAESESSQARDFVVLTSDGKGIVMRREDLREATRKRAKEKSHKLKHRMTKGEKKNAKRMATVGAVYYLDKHERSAEDIVGELSSVRLVKKKPRPRAIAKRVWASLEKSQKQVIGDIFAEALRRDPEQSKLWLYLVDGEKNQIKEIKKQAKAQGIEVTIILDLIHVIEYLWKASRVFHAETSHECEAWVHRHLLAILRGRSSRVAGSMRRSATMLKLSKKKREAVDKCANYLQNNAPYLRYDKYLVAGYPIATGVIEGACRHLIKDRMDLTGARWSLKGAEAVLKLRSLRSSGDFNQYWDYHEFQEYQRNHESQYENPAILNKLRGNTLKLVKNSST